MHQNKRHSIKRFWTWTNCKKKGGGRNLSSSLFLSNLIAAAVPSFCILKIALFSALLAKGQSIIRTWCTEKPLFSYRYRNIFKISRVIWSKHLVRGKWNFNVPKPFAAFRWIFKKFKPDLFLFVRVLSDCCISGTKQYEQIRAASTNRNRSHSQITPKSFGIYFKWVLVTLYISLAYKHAPT